MAKWFNFNKWIILTIFNRLLASLGFVWITYNIIYKLFKIEDTFSLWCFLCLVFIVSLFVIMIDGYLFTGYFKRKITIPSNTGKINIFFDDIFEQTGWKVIAVNEYFDDIVDNKIISKTSLHGQMLTKYSWNGDTTPWTEQVDKDLSSQTIESINNDSRKYGKKQRYPLGTTIRAKNEDKKFLCVALSRFNDANESFCTMSELYTSITSCLKIARETCANESLSFPFLGDGLARVGFTSEHLLNFIITAIHEESKNKLITKEINIILPVSKKNEISLCNIKKFWSSNGL